MTANRRAFLWLVFNLLVILAVALGAVTHHRLAHSVQASAPISTPADKFTKQYIATIDVARVFGRSQGCAEADPKLIDAIAAEALASELDPRIFAATVAVESGCDPFAVSKRGAIGLTQIMPRIWRDKFDFAGSVNLLNPHDNLHAGAVIEGGLIKQYGVASGVRRYNGTGVGCPDCDGEYVNKILALAGRK